METVLSGNTDNRELTWNDVKIGEVFEADGGTLFLKFLDSDDDESCLIIGNSDNPVPKEFCGDFDYLNPVEKIYHNVKIIFE